MTLKQSAIRNQRGKGFKVNHAVIQMIVLLLVCVWLVYQLKQFYLNNNSNSAIGVSFVGTTEGVSLLGRKGLLIDPEVKEGSDEEQDVEKVEEEEPEQLEDFIDEEDKDERIGKTTTGIDKISGISYRD